MPDQISCPHCRRVLQVPDAFAGREVRCPECQATFVAGPSTDFTAKPPSPAGSAAIQANAPLGDAAWPTVRHSDDTDDDVDYRAIGARPFRPAGGLATAAKVMFALSIFISVVILGSEYLQYRLGTRLVQGEQVPITEIDSNNARQLILGLVYSAIYLATVIVFLMWFYRVHTNLEPLGTRDLSYSSGYAVGCWFIPFLNLVRPAQVAQEIWRNSDPTTVSDGIAREGPGSGLIGVWWIVWIISSIIANISVRMAWSVNSPESLLAATTAGMIAEMGSIIAALLALSVVVAIDSRQSARAFALHPAQAMPQEGNAARFE